MSSIETIVRSIKALNPDKQLKFYISGQISGREETAHEFFQKAEDLLYQFEVETVNPTKLPHDHDQTWLAFMREDIKALCDCNGIYMLKGWENSKGAVCERQLAESLGFEIISEE